MSQNQPHTPFKRNQAPPAAVAVAVAHKTAAGGQPYTKPVRKKRGLWIFLSILALVVGGFVFFVLSILNSATGARGIFGGLGRALQIREDPRQFFPGKDRLVVLVLGKDYNRDRKGMPYTKGARSDTMMVLGIDLINPQISAVSIPRDSRIRASDGVTGKMNAVITRGGPQLVQDTLSAQFGVRPDYYVLLKPDAVRKIVDSLGGVDVEAIDDMNYDDNWGQLHVHIPKGRHRLNGEQAEGFVRFRKTSGKRTHKGANLEEGDIRRAARQQQLIHAMVESAKSSRNWTTLHSIIETGFGQIETNMSRAQFLALGSLFQEASKTAPIQGGTLPGSDATDGTFDWLLDLNRSTKMMQWLVYGDRYAGQSLPRVAVYNYSNAQNAARSIASLLYSEGYDAYSGGGRSPLAETSSVSYRFAMYKTQADNLATRLGTTAMKDPNSNPADTWSPEIKISVGTDLAQKFTPVSGTRTTSTTTSRGRGRRSR